MLSSSISFFGSVGGFVIFMSFNLKQKESKIEKVFHDRELQNLGPKGQLNSEWIYEVIVSPKMPTKNYQDFCPRSLLEDRTEIYKQNRFS